jgi:crotonobetainyl-CoA:carnitine CoA-transferase CaiB-like acyl-CoA transferase
MRPADGRFADAAKMLLDRGRFRPPDFAAIDGPDEETRRDGRRIWRASVSNALDGIRVLDFSRVFAGPAATQILGDLGADIIKVEEPKRGDEARYFGVTKEALSSFGGVSPSFLALNRNKRSIALDLGNPAGRRAALRMAAKCDVVIHNFRPGAMARWGLGYAQLKAVNPGVIFCEFSAYGNEGPMSHIGANDLALQAHSGLMSITGEADRPPVRCGTAAIDLHAGLALVGAVLAALFHRERTGEGQAVETSLLLSSAHLMNYFYTEYWMDGTVRKPMGTANHLSVPNQAFPTADGSVVIIAPSDEMWQRCAAALDPVRLERPEYRSILDRQRHRDQLIETLSAVTGEMSSREVVERLAAVKVNVAKVNSVGEAADDPQLAAIGGVVEFEVGGRPVKAVSTPFKLGGTPAGVDRPPPLLGADTEAVLRELGFGEEEVSSFAAEGAFGSARVVDGG